MYNHLKDVHNHQQRIEYHLKQAIIVENKRDDNMWLPAECNDRGIKVSDFPNLLKKQLDENGALPCIPSCKPH